MRLAAHHGAVAGHSRRPAWCTLHCHSSGDSSGGESGARLQCCALLPQPSAPHSSQIFAGVACLLAAEEALLHAPAASTTCPQGSRLRHAVDAADLQGERALRPEHVRRWDRTAKMRRAPSTAQSLRQSEGGAAAGHGTRALQWQGNSDRPSVAKVAVRRGVRWKRERCCFCCAID